MQAKVFLKADKDKVTQRRHPWLFSGAIETVSGDPGNGETVNVFSPEGLHIGQGAFSRESKIRVRMWHWEHDNQVDNAFIARVLDRSIARRSKRLSQVTNAFRLVYAESDGFPGLIVDRYADFLVVQLLSAGAEYWRDEICSILKSIPGIRGIFERSDQSVRELEGLPQRTGVLFGEKPDQPVEIFEGEHKFLVDLVKGQKTGFYLDQRDSRKFLQEDSEGREVLNCFSYSGAFTVSALDGGSTHVTSLETSGPALDLERKNLELNGLPDNRLTQTQADVFKELRTLRDRARSFDLIILDPPKFAFTFAQVQAAARGYKDINLLALKLLRPGGLLYTFSCSRAISPDLFQKIVSGAAEDAGTSGQIIRRISQAEDHPVALNFPQAEYLKGLVVRVSGE